MSASKAGGAPSTLASLAAGLYDIAADDTALYLTNYTTGVISRLAKP